MHTFSLLSQTRRALELCSCLVLVLSSIVVGAPLAHGAAITQSVADTFGKSSFDGSGFTGTTNWSDGNAPAAGNTYTTSVTLRTPAAGGNSIFAGDSLTLTGNGSGGGGILTYKGAANTDAVTVNNLIFSGGGVVNATSVSTFTLAGSATISSGKIAVFQLQNGNGGITVSASIGGAGQVLVNVDASTTIQSTSTVAFTHANTYSGGTIIAAFSSLTAQTDGALGSGNVTVNGGSLTLTGGATNNYIGDSADLIIATGLANSSISLSFLGSDVIGRLSLNGGSSYLANKLYTTSELNALYGSSLFTGEGLLNVGNVAIPEPSTAALLVGVGLLAFVCGRRKIRCGSV